MGASALKAILQNRCGRDKGQCDCFVTKHNQSPRFGLKGAARAVPPERSATSSYAVIRPRARFFLSLEVRARRDSMRRQKGRGAAYASNRDEVRSIGGP